MNLSGDKSIIQNAKEAVETSNKQTTTEKMNLKLTTIQMDSYTQKQRLPTLQEVANILSSDGEVNTVSTNSKYKNNSNTEVASLIDDIKINIGNSKSIYVTLKEFPYEFEINDSLQLASIDGVNLIASSDTNNTATVSIEQYNALKSEVETLRSAVDALQYKTTMKTINKTELINNTIPSGSNALDIINITIDEDCYANIYGRYTLTNDNSLTNKAIILYVNETRITYGGKFVEGSSVNDEVSCTMELKKGDKVSLRCEHNTGSPQTIVNARIRINYFPISPAK